MTIDLTVLRALLDAVDQEVANIADRLADEIDQAPYRVRGELLDVEQDGVRPRSPRYERGKAAPGGRRDRLVGLDSAGPNDHAEGGKRK